MQGAANTRTLLTSHTRSKYVEVWDLRKFSSQLGSIVAGPPAEAFKCAGNAPDIGCDDGVIGAISGGPPYAHSARRTRPPSRDPAVDGLLYPCARAARAQGDDLWC